MKKVAMKPKERISFYIEDLETLPGKLFDFGVMAIIFLACGVYVVSTYSYGQTITALIHYLELFIGTVFLLEYLLRMWVAKNRARHALRLYSIIDLLAIMPLFVFFADTQFLWFLRVLRVFKLLRYFELRYFFLGKTNEARLIVARIIFTISTIVFVFAGLILTVERGKNPGLSTFMDAVYFIVVTLTTVGFGDIVPVTQAGRAIIMLMIASGIIFIPWQVGILVRRLIATQGKVNAVCRECGLAHHEPDASHCKHCGTPIFQENPDA
ncbi:ion transporter [archaeon]|nr:ion transporter [archaeon]